jgi:hypothetical protein
MADIETELREILMKNGYEVHGQAEEIAAYVRAKLDALGEEIRAEVRIYVLPDGMVDTESTDLFRDIDAAVARAKGEV